VVLGQLGRQRGPHVAGVPEAVKEDDRRPFPPVRTKSVVPLVAKFCVLKLAG
jgi:hypothetical protein